MGLSQATYGGKWAWFGGEKPLGFTFKTALDRCTIDSIPFSRCVSVPVDFIAHTNTRKHAAQPPLGRGFFPFTFN